MTCEEVRRALGAWQDRESDQMTEAAVRQHLDQCPACAALLKDYENIDRSLKGLTEEVPEGFADRVMAALPKQERPKKRRFAYGGFTALGAVAAVLILSVAAGLVSLPSFRMGRAADTAEAAIATEAAIVTEDPAPADAPTSPVPEPESSGAEAEAVAEDAAGASTLYAAQWQAEPAAEAAEAETCEAAVEEACEADEVPAEAAEPETCETDVVTEAAAPEEACEAAVEEACEADEAPAEAAVVTEDAESEETCEAGEEAAPVLASGSALESLEDLSPAYTVTIPKAFSQTLPEAVTALTFTVLADGTQYCEMDRADLEALMQELDGVIDLIIEDPGNTDLGRLILGP